MTYPTSSSRLGSTIPAILVALLFAASVGAGPGADGLRLVPPGNAQLTAADVGANGDLLVAWKATDAGWSEVQVRRDDRERHSWSFHGELVQGARWIDGGTTFLVSVVGPDGGEHRVYRVTPAGTLQIEWSSAKLESTFDTIVVSRDGTRWLGARFSTDSARSALGRVGEDEADRTWNLTAETAGPASELAAEQYSHGLLLEGTRDPDDVALLWGARLWISRGDGGDLAQLRPPADCKEIQSAISTRAGLWVQCYRGMDSEPSHAWLLYPDHSATSEDVHAPSVTTTFRNPTFLLDGTVLDLHRFEGRVDVYEPRASAPGIARLGTLSIPQNARVSVDESALRIETGDSGEYRVIPLQPRIASLRQAGGEEP